MGRGEKKWEDAVGCELTPAFRSEEAYTGLAVMDLGHN